MDGGKVLRSMAKIAILVPNEEIRGSAERLVSQYQNITCMYVGRIHTEHVAARARELEEQGCDIILARGFQAERIKRAVKLPVVNICVTAQELGGLVVELRDALTLPAPKIGLIGYGNMLCDTSQFDSLFGVTLKRYVVDPTVDGEEALRLAADRAAREGCHALIGGDLVCQRAGELGLCNRFLQSGEESIRAALEVAERVCYAIDLEKNNNAQIETMLNYTFTGIVQVDADGVILRANSIAYNLLNCRPKDMLGHDLLTAFPSLTGEVVNRVLTAGEEVYAILLPLKRRETVVNMAPILIDGRITGAILTLQEGRRVIGMSSELLHDIYLQGYTAKFRFDMLPQESQESRTLFRQAARIAKYDAPVLLTGEAGSGKSILAQCIHSAGFQRENAFVELDCQAYQADTLDTMLFGNYSARRDAPPCIADMAQNGTVYLAHIEALSDELQYKVLRLIQGVLMRNGPNRLEKASARVIASTETELVARVEDGRFRRDLYYALSGLCLRMRALRHCREDILGWVQFYLGRWQERYDRPVTLTQSARDYLKKYDWPGNLYQVDCVCEQIVLLAERRTVDSVFLRRQLEQLSPRIQQGTGQTVLVRDERAFQIVQLLQKYNGERQKVADELGVSKTTLWRYMKKYGIGRDAEY